MDLKAVSKHATKILEKYKYVALILLLGVLLMTLPSTKEKKESSIVEQSDIQVGSGKSIEESLASILGNIEGAGNVKVLLSLASDGEILYQTDDTNTVSDGSNHTKTETVMITDSQHNQNGLVRQIKSPIYRGAIIVCQGADSPAVRLAIVDAVSKVTGLGTDQISVLKMK